MRKRNLWYGKTCNQRRGLKSQNQSRFPADSHLKSSISEIKDRGGGKGVHFLNGLFKTYTKLNVFSL